jgi:hypothetical protein
MVRPSTLRPLRAVRLLGATALAVIALSTSGVGASAPAAGCGETGRAACVQPDSPSVAPAAPTARCGETDAADCSQPAAAPHTPTSATIGAVAVPCGEPGGADCPQPDTPIGR